MLPTTVKAGTNMLNNILSINKYEQPTFRQKKKV